MTFCAAKIKVMCTIHQKFEFFQVKTVSAKMELIYIKINFRKTKM